MSEICLDFESEVDKTMFRLLTDTILRHGTHVAVSSLIDANGITRIGFRPLSKTQQEANCDA